MIITEPNAFVAQYHDRMPVILNGHIRHPARGASAEHKRASLTQSYR
jgi:putative SOS response-associated peptidase YedK